MMGWWLRNASVEQGEAYLTRQHPSRSMSGSVIASPWHGTCMRGAAEPGASCKLLVKVPSGVTGGSAGVWRSAVARGGRASARGV